MDFDFDPQRFLKISPMWWGAIASAAAAGAILVPSKKILAGTIAGAALLALAYYKTPCCDACAQNAQAGTTPAPTPQPTTPPIDPAVGRMLAGQQLPGYAAGGGGVMSTYGNGKCFS